MLINRNITANDFIKIIKAEDGNNNWQDWLKSRILTFKNIRITGNIDIEDDFRFLHDIKLIECEIECLSISQGIFNKSLEFEDCFISLFIESEVIFNGKLSISKCQINDLYIAGSYRDTVNICNSTFIEGFKIGEGNFEDSVNFSENILHCDAKIYGGKFKNIFGLNSSIFHKECFVQNVNFENGIYLSDKVKFLSGIYFDSGKFKSLIIAGGSFGNIAINGGKFEKLEITGNPNIEKIHILFQFDLNIKYLRIDFSKIINKLYLIEGRDGAIQKLHLEGVVAKEVLCEFVSISTPDSISIDNLTNFGNIYFKDVTPPNLIQNDHQFFIIKNSDLGKTTFMGSDFSTLYLDFHSSKITESFLSDTIMPYQIKTFIRKEGIITIKDNPEQQRLGYGQLKKIYENRGDGVTALSYYAKEMNALMISPNIRFSERINLFFGRISNNHGTDWILGLISTFICGGVCFFFFCFHFNIKPSFTYGGWTFFWNNSIPAFLEFFNPLHKTKEIAAILKNIKPEAVKLNWDNSLVDFVSKISITYFEYQLIQAFRKYGKK